MVRIRNWFVGYVREVLLPFNKNNLNDINYLRDEIFFNILIYFAPLSILALVPSVFMSFKNGLPIVGIADLIAYGIMIVLMFNRKLSFANRKIIFISILYVLSIILIYYIGKFGPGMLFLLSITILVSVIYSANAAFYSALANTIICIVFGIMIYFKINFPMSSEYSTGSWIAVSSNLIVLSFVCAGCLNILLQGLKKSAIDKDISNANISAIIENTNAFIYSLDIDFRYITFNQALKKSVKQMYNEDIEPGTKVFGFLERSAPEEAKEWRDVYTKALNGNIVQFEKEFSVGNTYLSTLSFSITPIVEGNRTIGLSCFAEDITERKNKELERIKITNDLIKRNKDLEQFSYIVSHNLRAPVANIIGLTNVAVDTNLELSMKNEIMESLSYSVNKLDDVITDLNIILNTKQKINEKKEVVLFSEIANDVQMSIENLIVQENVTLHCDFSEINEFLSIKSYFNSIFYNLISNSIKYHQPNIPPIIQIFSKLNKNKIELHFKDNGMGIDLTKKGDQVFGLYKRFHLNIDGKGMGLFMIKTQIESIGGKINIQSEINNGTTFIVEFDRYE